MGEAGAGGAQKTAPHCIPHGNVESIVRESRFCFFGDGEDTSGEVAEAAAVDVHEGG